MSTSCKVYPVGTTLDASAFVASDLVTGVLSTAGTAHTCTFSTALAANTAYALVVDDTTG